jgi:hypothetical protein
MCFSRGWDGFCCWCGRDADLSVVLSLRVGSEVDRALRGEHAGTEARRGSPSLNGLTVGFMSALSRNCRVRRVAEGCGEIGKSGESQRKRRVQRHILRCRMRVSRPISGDRGPWSFASSFAINPAIKGRAALSLATIPARLGIGVKGHAFYTVESDMGNWVQDICLARF